MPTNKHAFLAAFVLAATPLASQAVNVAFQFDPADILIGPSPTNMAPWNQWWFGSEGPSYTQNGSNATLVLTNGWYFSYGLDAEVTGNNGLGIAAFETGMTNSTLSATSTAIVQTSPTVVSSIFTGGTSVGTADGKGGVSSNSGTSGSFIISNGLATSANTAYGANAFADLYTSQLVKPLSASNLTFTLTPTVATQVLQFVSLGINSAGSPTYHNASFVSGVDTISTLPVLTVEYSTFYNGAPQPIVSLVTTAPTTYANQLGLNINVTYFGPDGYKQASTNFAASNRGYGVITGFHTPDTEIYALEVLNNSGGALTGAQITAVISDINASASGVIASTVTGVYSNLFKGYDVLITGSALSTGVTQYLGIDFTASGDQDPATQGFTVSAIAAVPEPATFAVASITFTGLMLGRRRR